MNTIELLELKEHNFIKIKDLAEQQEEFLSSNSMQEFFLFSSKRECIKNEIEADYKKHKSKYGKTEKREKSRALSINQAISEVIESIMEVDKKIEQMVSEKKDNLFNEIKGLKKGRNAIKSYGNKTQQAQPRFIKRVG